jgi:hypothetical protein
MALNSWRNGQLTVFRGFAPLVIAAALLTGFSGAAAIGATYAPRSAAPRHRTYTHHHHRGISWKEHDRLVYAVSTLNAPLCSDGRQLSAVLWNDDGARIFDVGKSTANHQLYFIQVRAANKALLSVFAYQFGWKLPQGAQNYQCVTAAGPDVVAGYRSHAWKFEMQFNSTFPQS